VSIALPFVASVEGVVSTDVGWNLTFEDSIGIWELLKVVGFIAGLAAPATIPVGFCIILGHLTPPTCKGSLAIPQS